MAKNTDRKTEKAKKDIYGSHLLPDGVELSLIKDRIRDTDTRYTKVCERMRILDGTDRGKLWDVIKSKFPGYQLTPDSNWINFIKENLTAYRTNQITSQEFTTKLKLLIKLLD